MSVGKRVFLQRKLVDKKVMEELGKIPAANVADAMDRTCGMNPRIRLMSKPLKPIMVGPALTVKVRSGDNLALHAAMNIAKEGDVIVVANEGQNQRALMGEIMMSYLHHFKKIAGIILDGPIRDIEELKTWDFPIYATGTTPAGPFKEGPGEVNVPISCGEINVEPGDVILADEDGIIVIPRNDAAEILEAAKKIQENDAKKVIASKTGSANRQWVTDLLEAKKFDFIDKAYE